MKALFLTVVLAVVGCSGDAVDTRSATPPPLPASATVVSSSVTTPAPSIDGALVVSHEAACQAVAEREGGSWPAVVSPANRVIVLQSYDRPAHLYTDGQGLVVCLGTGGHAPFFETYQVAQLVADRLKMASLDNSPPIGLTTPLVCIRTDQWGAYIACTGVVDPIVAATSFRVPGVPAVPAMLGSGPRIAIGGSATHVYFLAQWPGSAMYTDWYAFDSCGSGLGQIAMPGAGPTPTPCPAAR